MQWKLNIQVEFLYHSAPERQQLLRDEGFLIPIKPVLEVKATYPLLSAY